MPDLTQTVYALQAEVASLSSENISAKVEIARLGAEVEKLRKEVEQIKAERPPILSGYAQSVQSEPYHYSRDHEPINNPVAWRPKPTDPHEEGQSDV